MRIYNDINSLKDIPVLKDGQIYIYAILNSPQGNIKIGKTSNIMQRMTSLSGSNGGGSKISKIYLSPTSTWMQSMEETCHNHYNYCRISDTEWFDGEKVTFEEITEYIERLFTSETFTMCNEIRRMFIEKHHTVNTEKENLIEISPE